MTLNDVDPFKLRRIWESKPVLRAIYRDYYRRLTARLVDGRTLEVGGGSGDLKSWAPQVTSMDILSAPWLDVVADAQALPFRDGGFANVVLIDVLHHIARPIKFLMEASRILKPGGRLIMLEPAVTPLSWPLFRFLHHEPMDLSVDPFLDEPMSDAADPWDANIAIPSLLFVRHRRRLLQALPSFRLAAISYVDLLAYPLSGGFRKWSLLPAAMIEPLLAFENILLPRIGFLMAFRLLVVLDRC